MSVFEQNKQSKVTLFFPNFILLPSSAPVALILLGKSAFARVWSPLMWTKAELSLVLCCKPWESEKAMTGTEQFRLPDNYLRHISAQLPSTSPESQRIITCWVDLHHFTSTRNHIKAPSPHYRANQPTNQPTDQPTPPYIAAWYYITRYLQHRQITIKHRRTNTITNYQH